MKYEFRAITGQRCCAADDPTLLCRACRARAAESPTPARDLIAVIRAAHAPQPSTRENKVRAFFANAPRPYAESGL